MIASSLLAEQAMSNVWRLKEAGALDKCLEIYKNLGHSTVAVDFTLNPDSYYFPDVTKGEELTPETDTQHDQIAVVALGPGEYSRKQRHLHYLQKHALKAAGVDAWNIRDAEKDLSAQKPTFKTSGGPHGTASTFYNLAPLGKSTDILIESQPMIILNVDSQKRTTDPICPGVVLHEMMHVSQSLSNPVREARFNLRRELEAYAVQAQLLWSYDVEYSLGTAMASTVDQFRHRYLGADEFDPTPEFQEAMAKDDILHKIIKEL